MKDVQENLEALVPEPARIPDWDAVLRDARPRRRALALHLALATGIAALAALFVVSPWEGAEQVGVLDRALAAVGDGQVVHVVLRGQWGGTLVDLKTGERRPVYAEQEIWYDTGRNLAHEISRFGNAVVSEAVYNPEKQDQLTALTRGYRQALKDGTALVAGKDVFDGRPVYWVTIRRLMLPDVADHRDHEFAEEVAVSTETFKPVAIRALRDRHAFDTQRVLTLETVDMTSTDFTMEPGASLGGRAMMSASHPIALERSADVLGRTPYWLGSTFLGLPLAQAQQAVFRIGSVPTKTLVTGARAKKLRDCLRDRSRSPHPCPHTSGAIEQHGGKIYELGRSTFGRLHTGLTFFYGSIGGNPGTFKKDTTPLLDEEHVTVTETTDRELRLLGAGPFQYLPPEGSIVLGPGDWGQLVSEGLYITIQASTEKRILEAARSLRPMPSAGSGAGE